MPSDQQRDLANLVIPPAGRVVKRPDNPPGWELQDPLERPVAPVQQYLTDCLARDMSPGSIGTYAQDLLRWYRALWAWRIAWDQVTAVETRDFVLWMKQARKSRPTSLTKHVPGAMNLKTGKRALGDTFAPVTINHNLSVVQEFYRFHIETGRGPVRNPVPQRRARGGDQRVGAHHNPAHAFVRATRASYRQKTPDRHPRSIPDSAMDELFVNLRSDRDRALVAFYLSSGARATELLTMTNEMVDYGNLRVGVVRKGSRNLQWIPASPDAFEWLALYQRTVPEEQSGPSAPVWWTRRKPYRPLNYLAARAMFRQANEFGGTDWTLHALRHTAATRMACDPNMRLTDVQWILGHAWITTTQRYIVPRVLTVVLRDDVPAGVRHRGC